MSARRRMWLLGLALALLSTVFTLLALELALRIRRGAGLFAESDPTMAVGVLREGYPARYDPTLGYVPKAGLTLRDPRYENVTIDDRGLRENGGPAPDSDFTLLAVGDSFTWGDQVDDRETWPAVLERRLGLRVANGGVFGYGFDQIALRAEALTDQLSPDVVIVSLIPDDVARSEFSYRLAHKPYFERVDGELVLRNVPVPDRYTEPPGETAWRRRLRRSFLFEFVMHRLDPVGWLVRGTVRVHRDGAGIARGLVDRLAAAAKARGQGLLLVAAWHPAALRELLDPVREQARERRIPLLELEPMLRREIVARGGEWKDLFFEVDHEPGHMTPLGNTLVAEAIAKELQTSGLLRPGSG